MDTNKNTIFQSPNWFNCCRRPLSGTYSPPSSKGHWTSPLSPSKPELSRRSQKRQAGSTRGQSSIAQRKVSTNRNPNISRSQRSTTAHDRPRSTTNSTLRGPETRALSGSDIQQRLYAFDNLWQTAQEACQQRFDELRNEVQVVTESYTPTQSQIIADFQAEIQAMQRLDVGYKKQREAYRLMTKAAQVKTRFDMEFTRQQGLMHSRYLDLRQEVTRTLHQQKSRNLDALIALRSQWALQSPSISVAQSEDETQATYTLTLIDRAITQNNESSSSFDFPDFETLIQSAHIALDNFHKKIEEQQQEARETWSDCQQENMRRRKAHRNDKSYSAVDPDELKSALSFFGIQGNTPRPAIRKRYRRLAMKYHPDKSNKENNEEMMKTLNRHYEVLKLHFDLHKD